MTGFVLQGHIWIEQFNPSLAKTYDHFIGWTDLIYASIWLFCIFCTNSEIKMCGMDLKGLLQSIQNV